jgi:hypothetical protein
MYVTELPPKWLIPVMHKDAYSSPRPIQAGVPQNSLLGPTLFNIYVIDVPAVEVVFNVDVSVCPDDTSISVQSGSIDVAARKLNAATGLSEPWFRKWRIRNNTNKCTITPFSKRLRHCHRCTRPVEMLLTKTELGLTKQSILALHLPKISIQNPHVLHFAQS